MRMACGEQAAFETCVNHLQAGGLAEFCGVDLLAQREQWVMPDSASSRDKRRLSMPASRSWQRRQSSGQPVRPPLRPAASAP